MNTIAPTISPRFIMLMRKGAAIDWFELSATERAKWISRKAFIRARMREAREKH
jgi:hypothetical protein